MPDDDKTEVAEQTEEKPVTTETSADLNESTQEALDGFNEPDSDEKKTEEKKDKKKQGRPKKVEKEAEKEDKSEIYEESPEGPEGEGEEEPAKEEKPEEDEDEKIGEEVLKKETEAERKAREDEEKEQERLEREAAQEEAKKGPKPYGQDEIKTFSEVIPDTVFPDKVMIGDVEVDLKGYVEVNPEVKTISTIVAKGIIDTLIRNEYLPSHKSMEKKIADLEKKVSNQRFLDLVTNPQFGVPKAQEIFNGKDFKEWHDKQTVKIQALFRSDDPYTHIKGFKRFLKAQGLDDAKGKVADLDKKRAEAKEKADSIYKTTIKSKGKAKTGGKSLSPMDEAMEGFESEED